MRVSKLTRASCSSLIALYAPPDVIGFMSPCTGWVAMAWTSYSSRPSVWLSSVIYWPF